MIAPSIPAAERLSSTYSIIGRPATGTSTLGRSDFIRVPLPAAKTTATTGWPTKLVSPWVRNCPSTRLYYSRPYGTVREGFQPNEGNIRGDDSTDPCNRRRRVSWFAPL